jgi:hypothetical protein
MGFYLEPSVFLTVLVYTRVPYFVDHPDLAGEPLVRVAGGIRPCAEGLRVRFGVTAYQSLFRRSGAVRMDESSDRGIGAEAELAAPIERFEVGGRLGVESALGGSAMFTAGVRARWPRAAWVGVDLFHITRSSDGPACADSAVLNCTASTSGVMAGLGLSGTPGLVGAGVAVLGYALLLSMRQESD